MSMPRIWDCFLFFRELDLLEIRLAQLSPMVHRFVLVEAAYDFRGQPKPLIYAENKARFAAFADKIEHVVVETEPPDPDARWARQRWQRDQVLPALTGAAPDDLVMISDLDEIPTDEALAEATRLLTRAPCAVVFEMPQHLYRLDLRAGGARPACTRMVRRRHFKVPHLVRQFKKRYWKSAPDWMDQIPFAFHAIHASGQPLRRHVLKDAGWHLTSIGGEEVNQRKMRAFALDENIGAADAKAAQVSAILAGDPKALAGYERIGLDQLPRAIRENASNYSHLFLSPPE